MACVRRWRDRWVVDWRDENGKRHIEAVDGKRDDAERRLAEIVDRGKKPVNKNLKFREYGEWWLENCERGTVKESTFEEFKAVLLNHLNPRFGSWPLAKVSRRHIRELVAEKRKSGLKDSTIKNILVPMRIMYGEAVEDGELLFSPFTDLKKLKLKKKTYRQDEINRYSKEEVASLLKTAKEQMPHYYPLLLCACRTGLREGELIGLKFCDIDFAGRFIAVRRNVVRGRITTPKNGKTRRVDMSLQLTNVLDTLLAQRKAEALRREMEKPAEERRKAEDVLADVMDSWVFLTPEGTQLDPNNMRKRIYYRCQDLAELRRLRFHDLRHTFASLLIERGESLAYVRDQLGHSSIEITANTYGHLIPGTNKQAVDALDDVSTQNENGNSETDTPEARQTTSRGDSGNKMETIQLDRGTGDA